VIEQPPLSRQVEAPFGTVTFRRFRPGDEPGLLAVLDRCFDQWPPFPTGGSATDFLRWYADSWSPDQRSVHVSEVGGRIIGTSVGFLRPLLFHGRLRPGRQGGYSAVDPDFRLGGLSKQMVLWRRDQNDTDISWGFSQVEAMQRNRVTRGTVHSANPLQVYLRVLKPTSPSSVAPKQVARASAYALMLAQGNVRRQPAAPTSLHVTTTTHFDEHVDRLWERASGAFELIPWTGAAYLNWRYFDWRTGPATALVADDGDALAGYVVLRQVADRSHLVDLLTVQDGGLTARALVEAALSQAASAGAAAVECTLPAQHPYVSALRDAGFVRLRKRSEVMAHKFGVSPVLAGHEEIAFLNERPVPIHIVEGDSDVI
jgi:hypothetical protein